MQLFILHLSASLQGFRFALEVWLLLTFWCELSPEISAPLWAAASAVEGHKG